MHMTKRGEDGVTVNTAAGTITANSLTGTDKTSQPYSTSLKYVIVTEQRQTYQSNPLEQKILFEKLMYNPVKIM